MNSIYLNENGKMNELKSVTYDLEADLQKIISDNPELLLGGTTDTSRKYKLIADEKGIPAIADGSDRWQVDHLFVDNNAVLTFVEDKRSTDTRIRREVVGQALEYAANAVKYWDIDSIRKMYEANNTVMVHIRRLREKIEVNPREAQIIKTVWGVGYKIDG